MQANRGSRYVPVAFGWCMMCRMGKQWDRLALAIQAARKSRRMPDGTAMTQRQLAEATGLSLGTVQNLEDPKKEYSRQPRASLAAVEAVFWQPGSVDAVLDGDDPTPQQDEPPAPDPVAEPALSHLPLRVRHELAGVVVDTEVLDLSRSGMKMVVVVTREADAEPPSDEQMRNDLREWSRLQRLLRNIVTSNESDDPSSF